MDDEEQEQAPDVEYGLVMPFVAVHSKGGPYDDEAYCAGYEMGQLDELLAAASLRQALGDVLLLDEPMTIRAANREQADLIAMRHGYVAETQLADVEGWAYLRVRPAAGGDG